MRENQGEWCTDGGRGREVAHGRLLFPCASDPESPASVKSTGKGAGLCYSASGEG